MAPTLYMVYPSPPSRAVLMTAKAIGLNLNIKEVDFLNKAHLKPDYVKLNPQSTVPTFVDDDGFAISDSHAIMAFIVGKYAKDDSLYPKDLKKRAVVDQRLYFECGVVFAKLGQSFRDIIFGTKSSITQQDIDGVLAGYGLLETFLEGTQWVAGDSITIADYSLISSISTVNTQIPVDSQKFPNVAAWMKKFESRPEYQENMKGVERWAQLISRNLKKA